MHDNLHAKRDSLPRLSKAVSVLLRQSEVRTTIKRLKKEIRGSKEPYVWATLDLESVSRDLPETIRSAWIFVLKKERWSGAHMHPKSVQHMVVIEGSGESKIADIGGKMSPLRSTEAISDDQWFVIDAGTYHEFRPLATDMVVMSFHTCQASELIEISSETGESRRYLD